MLKKGDPCRVRLHTGEVVEAVYYSDVRDNDHAVIVNGRLAIAYRYRNLSPETRVSYASVRFVGNPCVLVPIGGEK